MERRVIEIQGIVQGVGFRPFIKLLADRFDLSGNVCNMGSYVRIEAQAGHDDLDNFISAITREAPPLSRIQNVSWHQAFVTDCEEGFYIVPSDETAAGILQVPADAGICKDCLEEMTNEKDRRFLHPFIACTNCGPRYSMIEGAPYDRERTSMKDFPLCDKCREEYDDPGNRRYHAQPVCCKECGPRLFILDNDGRELNCRTPLSHARGIIAGGGIVAAKGLGGYHLICNALNREAVSRLRERKKREVKPLAIMAPDLDTASKWCEINDKESELLLSAQRPIVLLQKQACDPIPDIPEEVAFNNPYLGMMLPSTGLQRLLFDYPDGMPRFDLLVMTSGNISEEPICIDEDEALEKLGDIADCILAHDRRIITRTDDSVTRVFRGKTQMIRRARGFAPLPITLPFDCKDTGDILAAGAQTKNTWCLAHKGLAFIGPHIGDLDDMDAYLSYITGIERFSAQTGITPGIAVHDLHPDYLSTQYAIRFKRTIPVQHHHAHMAATMAENGLKRDAIGIIFDGLGMGEDGSMWGGEFLAGDYSSFNRIGHINPVTMAGGDRAAKEPRLAASFWLRASTAYGKAPLALAKKIEGKENESVENLLRSKTLSYETSSVGRLFEAVSAMLGIRQYNRYEGEAAMELEWAAEDIKDVKSYDLIVIDEKETFVIDLRKAMAQIAEDILSGHPAALISARFHETMAEAVKLGAIEARRRTGVTTIVLSGGVFQNIRLLNLALDKLSNEGFKTFIPGEVPTNDGGISLGQAAIASARLSRSYDSKEVA